MPVKMSSRRLQRGLSIVELMVGVAVGLTIAAAATMMVASQLADTRRLLVETQIQQDLRATADQIARDLRRAGFWHGAYLGTSTGAGAGPIQTNPYRYTSPGDDVVTEEVTYTYAAPTVAEDNAVTDPEWRGFRLRSGVIESQLGAGNWQALTDATTLRVTKFGVTRHAERVELACALACSAGPTPCPPQLVVHRLTVDIAGEAVHDAAIRRSVRAEVRLRNDTVVGECRE
jgi:type IV pilus assembly protein PilW